MPHNITRTNADSCVTVVVVNYNGGELVLRCLKALQQQRFQNFQTVVVDNQSTDNSIAIIRQQFPTITVVALSENKGFAGGVNAALRAWTSTPLVALLNPDAFPATDWLGNLVTAAELHPEFVAFGSRMFSDDAMQVLDGVGDVYHISGLPWRQGHGLPNTPRYDYPTEIFAPCAAAALYRTNALRTIGSFDDDFFLYTEDVDVGFRLRLAGYRCLYVPSAKVWHLGSALVGKHSDFQIYHGHRNLVWVFVKNMPTLLLVLLLPLHLALNLVSLLLFSFRGQANTIWRAKRDAFVNLPQVWKKRKNIQRYRKASVWTIARALRWNPMKRW